VTKKEAPVVTVTMPVTDEVTDFEDFTGQTMAMLSVDIRARVTGYLDKVFFQDGAEVEEGAPLFEIDPRPYKAQFDQTEATLAQAEAHLKRLDADYRRASNLYARSNISREEYDKIAGDRAEAEAAVGIAKASRDLAKLDLGFTKITAPISGRLSRRQVDPGNLVKQDDTILTNIVSLDPMFLYFDVDEQTVLRIRRLIREGKIKSREEAEVPILAALSVDEGFPHRGTFNFVENKVDPNTGTLRVRALISNPKLTSKLRQRELSPGMYMKVRVPIGSPHKAILVPEQAVGTDQGRKFVYVVDTKDSKQPNTGKVVERTVEVGSLNGQLRVIQSGLNPGERVVYRGLQRIRPGVEVRYEVEGSQKPPGAATTVAKSDQKPTAAPVADTGKEPTAPPAAGTGQKPKSATSPLTSTPPRG
jgi:RND family efflux transporter MFP subunit